MAFTLKKKYGLAIIEFGLATLTGTENVELSSIIHDLTSKGEKHVILDLKLVEYANSSGLGLLASSLSSVKHAGGALSLVHLSDRVRDLLEVTKLNKVIPCYDSVADVVKNV